MVKASSSVLFRHKDLATLFSLTYYALIPRQKMYNLNQGQIEQTAQRYNITSSLLNAPSEHRSECLERLEVLLQDEMRTLLPGHPHNWITWL
jgi:hypothetical protein